MRLPDDTAGEDLVCREYSRIAGDYDRRWSRYVDRCTRATLARFTISEAARVVDIGCGTGVLLGHLVETLSAENLVGADLTPAMLNVAQVHLPAATSLQIARAEALPLSASTFDVALSCSVFHYISEPQRALREMYRVLRPGGQIVITDWCHDALSCRILDRWLRFTGRSHHRMYRAGQLAAMLENAGLTHITCDRYQLGWWGMMTLTACKPE